MYAVVGALLGYKNHLESMLNIKEICVRRNRHDQDNV